MGNFNVPATVGNPNTATRELVSALVDTVSTFLDAAGQPTATAGRRPLPPEPAASASPTGRLRNTKPERRTLRWTASPERR